MRMGIRQQKTVNFRRSHARVCVESPQGPDIGRVK